MCFDEEYVNQFVFKPDELLSNSFEILIKNDFYKEKESEIETIVAGIKQHFNDSNELATLISNLNELSGAFKVSKTGKLNKTAKGYKTLSNGNNRTNVPVELTCYQPLIQSEDCVKWIDWQMKGKDFLEVTKACPYCSAENAQELEHVQKVRQEYDKATIRNLVSLTRVLEGLGDYFSDETKDRLVEISNKKDGLNEKDELLLVEVKQHIDRLTEDLEKLKTISNFDFDKPVDIDSRLKEYKIDLRDYVRLSSLKTEEAIGKINKSIDIVLETAGKLQGVINHLKATIQNIIKEHQDSINGFLADAGYRYQVEIVGDSKKSQLKLQHFDHKKHLSGGDQHLSFGERNAFAIVLFMYECLSKHPELIILDDPISSFDKNKKFAILEMLFLGDKHRECLNNKTVLMLTHDVEPIIDTIKSLDRLFNNRVMAAFLKLRKGEIKERTITKGDVQTFFQICTNVLKSASSDLIKVIYLRRKWEIYDDKSDVYEVLSNLFHKRRKPEDHREEAQGRNYPKMDETKFTAGCEIIKSVIKEFSYDEFLDELLDNSTLIQRYNECKSGYEKLQIYRLIADIRGEKAVVRKFINETYHIENEFVCQLDPAQFDTIPEYIIQECDKKIAELSGVGGENAA